MRKILKKIAKKVVPGRTISYVKAPNAQKIKVKAPKQVQVRAVKPPAKAITRHYGEKGYKPSSGKGVGY